MFLGSILYSLLSLVYLFISWWLLPYCFDDHSFIICINRWLVNPTFFLSQCSKACSFSVTAKKEKKKKRPIRHVSGTQPSHEAVVRDLLQGLKPALAAKCPSTQQPPLLPPKFLSLNYTPQNKTQL